VTGEIEIYPTPHDLVRGAAGRIASLLAECVQARGRAMIALSGGGTPRHVYRALASDSLQPGVPWENVHVFWGDERCVPPDHPESNFGMANETLLSRLKIPAGNIHRIMGEKNPQDAARRYDEELRRTFPVDGLELPKFDVMLLGLGDDGHTASLFPGTPVIEQQRWLAIAVRPNGQETARITLTFPVINNSRHVLFLVSGKGKSPILAEVLHGSGTMLPAQLVSPVDGELRWLVDQDAASQIQPVAQR
jgi:6-phosphogluconolactonase